MVAKCSLTKRITNFMILGFPLMYSGIPFTNESNDSLSVIFKWTLQSIVYLIKNMN